jgi:hypothetical protein
MDITMETGAKGKAVRPYMTKTDIASKLASDNGNAGIARNRRNGKKLQNPPLRKFHHPNQLPTEIKEQNKLIDECYEYILTNNIKDIDEFPLSKHMSPYRFKRLALNNPYFAEVLELCLYSIGRAIQKDWYEFNCEKSLARDLLWTYKKDYREDRKEMAKEAAEEAATTKNYVYHSALRGELEDKGDGREKNLLEVQAQTLSDTGDKRSDE